MESLRFLTEDLVREIAAEYGTPTYVYSRARLEAAADACLAFPAPFGHTVRYAMKALPNATVLRIFADKGLHIDASSGFEAERALRADIAPERIQITAQQIPDNLQELIQRGCLYNACSLHQLRHYAELFPEGRVSVRINPGKGSGHSNRTNVGGPSSSFGIWHEQLPEIEQVRREFGLNITGMHTHIGSGGDPEVWKHCALLSLSIAAKLPDVETLSLGGGFKAGRMDGEPSADLQEIGNAVRPDIEAFAKEHGRELHIEIEPGTFLTANTGAIVTRVVDVVSTGANGYDFIKIDSGMTEVLRPSLYGAQHPLVVVPAAPRENPPTVNYVVCGHCCESGDILTPAPGDPEILAPRELTQAFVGDYLVIEGAGSYCASMPAKNYNSFPEAPEVLLENDNTTRVIRKRQSLDQVLANEVGN